ncbi:DKNYY domain-containing protein [Fusobacterium animalis]|uniref:DKNYY domain-containing protein n=1 Tax=Fusobacterium animalis TaxID=76859 RepID=UPI0029232B5E|nr:DKNYY domain-containing protein [Fusobacterium nucleatum]BEP01480.1 DKNYY domain-containing protein [Fusobacterium nucleatum]
MKINGEDLSISKEKNSRKALSKTLLKVVIISILIVVISYLVLIFSVFKMKSDYNFNQEILNNGQKYEKSIYIKYKDKIYACVYGLFYQLDNVDIGSFKVLDSMDYSDSCVAVDKNNVYFGNQIVSDLDPNKLYTVGNDYYSDGINSYFCLDTFEKTEDLANKSKIRQYIEYYFFKGEKPQEYSYPFKKVETTKTLKAIEDLRYLASDGEKVYYKGELIKDADLDTLKAVDQYNDDYFYDKKNVYYKTKALDLSSNKNLSLVSVEQGERTYLYDELNGNVSLEEYIFNKKYIPYQVLGIDSGHVKDLVFVSKDGIFFYNFETKEQERVGDNIFKGKVENILSSVISDDKNIYYLQSYNIYKKKRTKHGYRDILVSKNIGIFSLGEKKDWEKIKDIDSGTTGEVWRKGNKYYYFDNLGVDQLIDDVVYEIKDNRTLEKLLDIKYISTDEIREFVRDKKLIAFKGEELTTASIKYKESHKAEIFLIVFFTIFIGIHVLILYLKWRKVKLETKEIDEETKRKIKEIESLIRSYDDEEEIKKEIDKIKPIVKNYDDIEGLKKQDKKIDITIKNYNNIERDKKIDSIIKNYNDKKEEK